MSFPRATELAHQWVAARVRSGDTVVDATAGNGFDTAFLAKLVGRTGRVFAFDVQPEALDATGRKLREAGLEAQTQLIAGGHENLASRVQEPLKALMFNLGYLPGSNKITITRPETTSIALRSGLNLLLPGGIVTLVLYTGHEGGREEADAVMAICANLNPAEFRAMRYDALNAEKAPPLLIGVERLPQSTS